MKRATTKYTTKAPREEKPHFAAIRAWLQIRLADGQPHLVRTIAADGLLRGWNRATLDLNATRLGVERIYCGHPRKLHWRLPPTDGANVHFVLGRTCATQASETTTVALHDLPCITNVLVDAQAKWSLSGDQLTIYPPPPPKPNRGPDDESLLSDFDDELEGDSCD